MGAKTFLFFSRNVRSLMRIAGSNAESVSRSSSFNCCSIDFSGILFTSGTMSTELTSVEYELAVAIAWFLQILRDCVLEVLIINIWTSLSGRF